MDRIFGVGNRIFTAIGAIAGVLVAAGQYLDFIPPEYRSTKWYAIAAALVALGAAIKKPAGKAVVGALVFLLALPVYAADEAGTTDPGAAIADRAANAPQEFRWSLKVGGAVLMPAVAVTPIAVSLRDWSVTQGFTVGAGYQLLWRATEPTARGVALYANLRSTAEGTRPLVSVLGIFTPYLGAGIGYQIGGAGSFRDSAVLLVSVGTNLGFK